MLMRPFKPHGIPGMFPYLTVQNSQRAIDFYTSAFGFRINSEPARNDEGEIQHVEMIFGEDSLIMFAPEGAYGSPRKAPASLKVSPSLVIYVYCPDVDALYKQAVEHGAISTVAPNDSFWGDRYCSLVDPDGHEWMFATNVADHEE